MVTFPKTYKPHKILWQIATRNNGGEGVCVCVKNSYSPSKIKGAT